MSENRQNAPTIKRVINGRTYTVVVHFSEKAKETAQEKINRMLAEDVKKAGNEG